MVDGDALWGASLGIFLLDETLTMTTEHFVREIAARKLDMLTEVARALFGVGAEVEHVDHVVFTPKDGVMLLECRRCGETYPATMPIPVRLLTALVDAFHKDHEHCERECVP